MDAPIIFQAHTASPNFRNQPTWMRILFLFFMPAYKWTANAVCAFFRTANDLVGETKISRSGFQAWRQSSQLFIGQLTDARTIAWADICIFETQQVDKALQTVNPPDDFDEIVAAYRSVSKTLFLQRVQE